MKKHTAYGAKRIRVGHTRWKVIFYDADWVLNHTEAFCAIYFCRVTKVTKNGVHYDCQDAGYICGRKKFIEITEPTFRKAIAKARVIIAEYEFNRDNLIAKGGAV